MMSDIKRYVGIEVHEAADGDMVDYADHVAAIAAEKLSNHTAYDLGYAQGQRDALAAAVQRVGACEGAPPSHLKVRINLSDAIAAIKGEQA
jgi:hypothetical protein